MRKTRASNIQSKADQSTQTAATYPVKDIGFAHICLTDTIRFSV